MKTIMLAAAIMMIACAAAAQDVAVQRIEGEVSVRHGVTEVWNNVAVGDILKPDDTMRTGARGSAVLMAQVPGPSGVAAKRIVLPPDVIVDLSDIRQLTQEELMLKLTMEKVRSSSYQWKNDDLHIPNTTVVHGGNKSAASGLSENDEQTGMLQFNGSKVLFQNGFYSTCALRALEVFRRYPSVGTKFDNRLLVADALEKASLRGEALNEYGALSRIETLTPDQRSLVQGRIQQLRK